MASGMAALIELMSVGKQNKVLNANPQITFWRFTHMRYTDFSLEQVKVAPNSGSQRLTGGSQTMHFDLPRSGDLVNNAFVVFHLPGLVNVNMNTDENLENHDTDYTQNKYDESKQYVSRIQNVGSRKFLSTKFSWDSLNEIFASATPHELSDGDLVHVPEGSPLKYSGKNHGFFPWHINNSQYCTKYKMLMQKRSN